MKTLFSGLLAVLGILSLNTTAYALDLNTSKVCSVNCVRVSDSQSPDHYFTQFAVGETNENAIQLAAHKCQNYGGTPTGEVMSCQPALEYLLEHLN